MGAITDMTWLELGTLGLLAVWNLCTYALWRRQSWTAPAQGAQRPASAPQ